MSYETREKINNRLQEHYEEVSKLTNNEIFGVFLQGSQNYIDNKFLDFSDIDSLALLIPSKRDVILGHDVSSETLIVKDKYGEEEHVNRFDVRKAFSLLNKASINNYEFLYSDFAIINTKYTTQFSELLNIREEIVRMDEKKFVMSVMGMSLRQKNQVDEDNSDYRKRVAHVIRLNKTLKAYIAGKDFTACLKAMDENLIHQIRTTDYYSLDEAIQVAKEVDDETRQIAMKFSNELGKDVEPLRAKINDILVDLVSASME